MKIVVLDGYTVNPGDLSWEGLEELGDLTVHDRTSEDQIIDRAGGAEIVYTNKTPLARETLEELQSTEFVGVLATGYNVVDIEAAAARGITVTNIPAYSTRSVAQLVFALLLEICHHVGEHNEAVHRSAWTKNRDFCFWNYPLIELAGKTIGIIGYGRIGRATAEIARAMGMRVLACTPHPDRELESEQMQFVSLEELLTGSDVISLHCPLFDSTAGMIDQGAIARMKDGVILINTSRGALLVEQDVADALENGKIAYAAMDVLAEEPPKADNPLLNVKNCIITPHIAWAPKESRRRLMDTAVNNLRAYLARKPENVVSP